jgi:hypothetical protein
MTRISQGRGSPSAAVEIATVCVDYVDSSTIVVADYDNTDYVHCVYCFFAFLLYKKPGSS